MPQTPQPPEGYQLMATSTPDGAPNLVRWGLPAAFAVIALWIGLSILLILPVIVPSILFWPIAAEPDPVYLVLTSALPSVAMGIASVFVSKRQGNGPVRDFGLRADLRAVGIGVAAGVGMLFVASIIAAAMTATGTDIPVAADEVFQSISDNSVATVLFIVAVVVIAPVSEELAYRGIWFGALERRFSARWAMLISSAIFAAMHFEPQRFVILLALGLALGELRLRTSSLTSCIAAHATVNSVAAVGMLLSNNLNYFQ